ncbi:hypothetical protein Vadar_024183 [Vaccinium darrowii]|uniref:Uncharacterized protein n=1 Tax=Vaccinium darrowii TaxID=229202 RepID=A0ACB7Z6T9_9ERIC|nr:hypothetical protein Vadar_024183 [Vaccinium darrowii]
MPTGIQIGWDGSEFIQRQMFSSKEEVKYSVQKYSMGRNCAVKTEKSSSTVLVYRCNNENPCLWQLRAIKITDTEEWKITRYAGSHNCISRNVSQDHASLTARHMASSLMSYMPTDPLWRPTYVYHRYCARHIGANFMRRYNKNVSIQVKVTTLEGQKWKYKRQLSKMINWDNDKIHKDLMDLDLPKWSLALIYLRA